MLEDLIPESIPFAFHAILFCIGMSMAVFVSIDSYLDVRVASRLGGPLQIMIAKAQFTHAVFVIMGLLSNMAVQLNHKSPLHILIGLFILTIITNSFVFRIRTIRLISRRRKSKPHGV